MTRLSFRARNPWRLVALAVIGVVATGLAVLPPHPAADAFEPPIVDIPKCYPRSFGTVIDCPTDLRNNGWGEAGTTSVVGTATSGQTYRVQFNPRVPPCQWSSESGCYTRISTYAPGNVYFLRYGASLSDQRLATNMTGSMSSHDVASWSPGYGVCEADWNGVYANGGDFAERAEVVRDCSLEFRYTKSDGTQAPLDRLLGPTWVRISSSITICDAANAGGCTQSHGEGSVTLVRVDGDMWESPVATCETVSQSGPGGSEIRFDGDSSVNTQLDSVRSWAFDPADVTVSTSDGYYRHSNTARVSNAAREQPGDVHRDGAAVHADADSDAHSDADTDAHSDTDVHSDTDAHSHADAADVPAVRGARAQGQGPGREGGQGQGARVACPRRRRLLHLEGGWGQDRQGQAPTAPDGHDARRQGRGHRHRLGALV
jgi:hypothetical protein